MPIPRHRVTVTNTSLPGDAQKIARHFEQLLDIVTALSWQLEDENHTRAVTYFQHTRDNLISFATRELGLSIQAGADESHTLN
jgi:hypothetical protein